VNSASLTGAFQRRRVTQTAVVFVREALSKQTDILLKYGVDGVDGVDDV
jgi:hypothetical protein